MLNEQDLTVVPQVCLFGVYCSDVYQTTFRKRRCQIPTYRYFDPTFDDKESVMGWVFKQKPENVKEYLWNHAEHEDEKYRIRALDVALKLDAAYIAVEEVDKSTQFRRVYAVVVLIRYERGDDLDFGTKWMSENAGPASSGCPERILDQLTDSENENANEWRMRCRHTLACRMPPVGTRVIFDRSISFQDGSDVCEFTIVSHARKKIAKSPDGRLYRINRSYWENNTWRAVGASI
ncbi:MAG: hypothetical protein GKR90_25490 [Pseudomonadales bacterium]|nr:hypothetical protein [Pseudomonadales bacterium]